MEIYYNNEWGTVCDDHWTIQEATIVCRTLGSPGVTEVVADNTRYSKIISLVSMMCLQVNFSGGIILHAEECFLQLRLLIYNIMSVVYRFVFDIITSSDLVLGRVRFGWMTWSALELRTSSTSVAILSLESTTVAMAKMLE